MTDLNVPDAPANRSDPDFELLLRYIQEARGVDFRGYKRTSLGRRIRLRMDRVGKPDFAAYKDYIEVYPAEFEQLLNTVLINVTSFFRDEAAWSAMRDTIIPNILASAGKDRMIRIWSVGCASGQEPYSIAILFAEAIGMAEFCRRVKIYATDLDEDALAMARVASYAPRDVEDVPPALLKKYFERSNNHYIFQRDLRKCVIFGRHNVVYDAPISRIDLLCCRNLLIYLEGETQEIVLPRLHYALLPTGYLFLGKAETQLARSQLFKAEDPKNRIFSKVPQEWRRTAGGGLVLNRPPRNADPATIDMRLLEAVLNEADTAYLVIDEGGHVSLANAAARQLLSVGEADIGRPFQDLPISYRPLELRGPIEEVLQTRRALRLEHQEFHASSTDILWLTIEIRVLARAEGGQFGVLLSFSDQTRLYNVQRELQTAQENLENSIEELQSANEELETTNEELQSTNEELETTNEELQSTNEELETINEEARSSNEEMESANEELRLQAEQATNFRIYLESVQRSLDMGVVVLDASQSVQSWNRWSETTWGLRAEEVIGTRFSTLDIGIPVHVLQDGLTHVQTHREQTLDQRVEGLDRRGRRIVCQVRISPLYDLDNSASGLVLTFEDITEQERQEEYSRYLGRIISKSLNEIFFLDPQSLRFLLANEGARRKLGLSDHQLEQTLLADVIPSVPLRVLREMIAPLLAGEKKEIVFETRIRPFTGREYPAEMCMQFFGSEAPPILVVLAHDTTERQQLES